MGFLRRFFRKKEPYTLVTFWEDWAKEQTDRIRRGEPIIWLPGTPIDITLRSQEIDRRNAELDERATR